MALPDLYIAPCEAGELAPGEPLCAPADYCIRVWHDWRFHTYLIRMVQARHIGKGNSTRLVAAQRVGLGPLTLFTEAHSYIDVVKALRRSLSTGWYWRRTLHLDKRILPIVSHSDWKFCLEIDGYGRAVWRVNDVSREKRCEFKIGHPLWRHRHWRKSSWEHVLSLVEKLLLDPESDCSFALRLLEMTRQEESELFFPVQRGAREECDSLLRLILQTDSQLDFSDRLAWYVPLARDPELDRWSPHHAKLHRADEWGGISFTERTLTARQMRLLELVVRYFGLYWRDFNKQYTMARADWNGHYICIAESLTTQHERMEARMQLCEWLQGKVAPEEIPFLLGEA